MRIPKEFQLMGHTIKVRFDKDDELEAAGAVGKWNIDLNEIWLKSDMKGTYRDQTFIHEVQHAVLSLLNYTDLSTDERFVDQSAALWHQMMTTQKF